MEKGCDDRTGVLNTTNRHVRSHDKDCLARVRRLKTISIDMETALIFIVGHHEHIARGALLLVSDVPFIP